MIDTLIQISINSFIVIMLFWMWFWDMDSEHPIKKYWITKIKKPFVLIGLQHSWKMFSPNPSRSNSQLKIKFFLKNDSVFVWQPKPFEEMSRWEKTRNKKRLKFYSAIKKKNGSFLVKISFVEYLLRKHNLEGKCSKVEILKCWQKIRPYSSNSVKPIKEKQSLVYSFKPA